MAHFAELDDNNIVTQVLAISDEQEHRGEEYLSVELGLGGRWIQTSYNHRIRKQYAGIGYKYDEDADVFIAAQPFPSWTLDGNYDWQPPVSYPNDGLGYFWNEEEQDWEPIGLE